MEDEQQRHEVCAVERVPGLYITGWVGASSVNEVNILNVTHILTILSASELDQYGPDECEGVELRRLNVADDPFENIIQYFSQECEWLDQVLVRGVVLVHCQQGVSRSAAIVVAYVMRKLQISFSDAFAMVKRSRSIVNLNVGFREQLKVWEQCRYDIFEESSAGDKGDKRKEKQAYTVWKRHHRQRIDSKVDQSSSGLPKSAGATSPKTPVREVRAQDLIDFLDSETD